jgi:competence protein ComEC
MDYIRKNKVTLIIGSLLFLNITIWIYVFAIKPKDYVSVSFLNIGQGDAALIEATNGNQILIDGGPNKIILKELGRKMSFFDRFLDLVIETHPDKDHIGGLPEVIKRFSIGAFIEPGVESENSIDDELQKRIKDKNISSFLARAGQVIDMGDGSYLKILFPDRDVSGLETNDASIVAQYVFGDTCFLFTGDSPEKIENYLVEVYGSELECNVLKVGHHGSKTSTGEIYIKNVNPEFAIISAGKNNSYNHPNSEVIERLTKSNIKILSTIELGTIKMISDGKMVYKK